MKKFIATMAALGALCTPMAALAQPEVKPYSLDAIGCMKLGECTDGVTQVKSADDVVNLFETPLHSEWETELRALIDRFNSVGVKVYVADGKNFPRTHRGSYYTDTNTFYLNKDYISDPHVFMMVLRHEGWHAAQDCMAGDINNTFIAVIHHPDIVPERWKLSAQARYGLFQSNAIPWEQEAIWAGHTPGMTADALNACASGQMWTEYDPTPKTREWLESNGYL